MLRKFTQSIYEGVFKRIGSYDKSEKTKLKKTLWSTCRSEQIKMTKSIRFAQKNVHRVYMKAFSNALDFTIEMRKRIRFRDKMS